MCARERKRERAGMCAREREREREYVCALVCSHDFTGNLKDAFPLRQVSFYEASPLAGFVLLCHILSNYLQTFPGMGGTFSALAGF